MPVAPCCSAPPRCSWPTAGSDLTDAIARDDPGRHCGAADRGRRPHRPRRRLGARPRAHARLRPPPARLGALDVRRGLGRRCRGSRRRRLRARHAASAAGLVVAGLCYALVPSAVGQFGAWAASIGLLCGLIAEIGDDPGTTPYGLALVALGAALGRSRPSPCAARAGSRDSRSVPDWRWSPRSCRSSPTTADELGYALTAAVAVAGFAGYLSTRSWSVLAVGVLATTLVVPEALHDWTDGSVSCRRLAADRRADAARRPARSVCGCAASVG